MDVTRVCIRDVKERIGVYLERNLRREELQRILIFQGAVHLAG